MLIFQGVNNHFNPEFWNFGRGFSGSSASVEFFATVVLPWLALEDCFRCAWSPWLDAHLTLRPKKKNQTLQLSNNISRFRNITPKKATTTTTTPTTLLYLKKSTKKTLKTCRSFELVKVPLERLHLHCMQPLVSVESIPKVHCWIHLLRNPWESPYDLALKKTWSKPRETQKGGEKFF